MQEAGGQGSSMVYLDWAATAVPDAACLEAAARASQEAFGNPSSAHPAGRRAREYLEASRAALAGALRCAPEELVFTSGATESNWLALASVLSRARIDARNTRPISVVASGIEHASVHDNLEALARFGVRVSLVPASSSGAVRTEDMLERLDPETAMVVLMAVNNVTGALQPVAELAGAARGYAAEHGRSISVHTDAVQALGKIPLDLAALGVDSASFSAHKIGGPRGVGALYVRAGTPFEPLGRGGEQERGLRAGTENCAGAGAFACAARNMTAATERHRAHALRLLSLLRSGLSEVRGCVILPPGRQTPEAEALFSPFIVSLAFPPIPSEVLVRVLSSRGICVSSGSACASRSREKRERVYRNMGLGAESAASAIRISTGPGTTEAEIASLVEALTREVPRLSRIAK